MTATSRRARKRTAWTTAVLAAAALAVSACSNSTATSTPTTSTTGTQSAPTSAAGGSTTPAVVTDTTKSAAPTGNLTVSIWGNNQDVDTIKAAAAGFSSKYPDVHVEFKVGDCGVDYAACKTLIAGKNMSDVLVTGSWNINQMINDGVLADLTDRFTADGLTEADFVKVVLDSDKGAKDGKIHALPMGFNVQSLFYNKDMFAKAGLADPPADGSYTWDDLRSWAKKLTVDNKGRNAEDPSFDAGNIVQYGYFNFAAAPIGPGYYPPLWANGGGVLNADQTQCQLEDPASVQTWQTLQDMMWKDHSTITPQLQQEEPGYLRWVHGTVAMQQGSHEQVGLVAEQNPTLKYGIAAVPKGSAGNATLVQVHSWAVYDKTSNMDAAWAFVKYMATEGSGKQMGLIPAYGDKAAGGDFAKAPGEPANLQQAQLDPASWPLTRTNVDPKGIMAQVEGEDGMGPALTDIVTNKKSAADALHGVCGKIKAIISASN